MTDLLLALATWLLLTAALLGVLAVKVAVVLVPFVAAVLLGVILAGRRER